jgi:signal transduction histidine kinase
VITVRVRYSWRVVTRSPLLAFTPALARLHLAGCAAWLAATIGIWGESAAWQPLGGLAARLPTVALLGLFLAAFIWIRAPSGDEARLRRRVMIIVAVMIVTTFGLMLLGSSNFTPILLVISAVVVASELGPRLTLALLVGCNAAFYCVARWLWEVGDPLLLVLIYCSFEAFAALSSQARARSESAAMELRRVNAELLATRALLAESARDSERLRVSRELHDVTGHKLTALNLNLELLRDDRDLAPRRELAVASQLGSELLADIRAVVSRLRSDDGIDLREALRRLAEPFPQPSIAIDVQEGLRVRSTEAAEVLLRAAQEGLTNSVRHSGAQHIGVSLRPGPGRIDLIVEDDGRFPDSYTAGNGLTGLRERVEEIGGSVGIDRSGSGGWRLTVHLPLRSPA